MQCILFEHPCHPWEAWDGKTALFYTFISLHICLWNIAYKTCQKIDTIVRFQINYPFHERDMPDRMLSKTYDSLFLLFNFRCFTEFTDPVTSYVRSYICLIRHLSWYITLQERKYISFSLESILISAVEQTKFCIYIPS